MESKVRQQIIVNSLLIVRDSKLRPGIPRVVLRDFYAHQKYKERKPRDTTVKGAGRVKEMIHIACLEDKKEKVTSDESITEKAFTKCADQMSENRPNTAVKCTFTRSTSISETVKFKSTIVAPDQPSTLKKTTRKITGHDSSTSEEPLLAMPSPPVIQLDSDSETEAMQADNVQEVAKLDSGEDSLRPLFFEEDLEGMNLDEEDDDFMHRIMGLHCSETLDENTSTEEPLNSMNSEDSLEEMSLSSYANALKRFLGEDESSDDENSINENEEPHELDNLSSTAKDSDAMETESENDFMDTIYSGSPVRTGLEVGSGQTENVKMSSSASPCFSVMELSDKSHCEGEPPFHFVDIPGETAISRNENESKSEKLETPSPPPEKRKPVALLDFEKYHLEPVTSDCPRLTMKKAYSRPENFQPPAPQEEKSQIPIVDFCIPKDKGNSVEEDQARGTIPEKPTEEDASKSEILSSPLGELLLKGALSPKSSSQVTLNCHAEEPEEDSVALSKVVDEIDMTTQDDTSGSDEDVIVIEAAERQPPAVTLNNVNNDFMTNQSLQNLPMPASEPTSLEIVQVPTPKITSIISVGKGKTGSEENLPSRIVFPEPEECMPPNIPVPVGILKTPTSSERSSSVDNSSQQNEGIKGIKHYLCPLCHKGHTEHAQLVEHIVVFHCDMLFVKYKHRSLTDHQFKMTLERFFSYYVSKGYCQTCKFYVPAAKKFTLRKHLVQNHFDEIRNNFITFQWQWLLHPTFDDTDDYVERTFELIMEGALASFVCNICGESMRRDSLLYHLGTHGFHVVKKCTFCNDSFWKTSVRAGHELMEHSELLFKKENIHNLSKEDWTKVVHNVLDNILDMHTDKPNKCPFCPSFILSEDPQKILRWKEHMVFKHFDYVAERILASQKNCEASTKKGVTRSMKSSGVSLTSQNSASHLLPSQLDCSNAPASALRNINATKSAFNVSVPHPAPTIPFATDIMMTQVACKYCRQTFPNSGLMNDHVIRSHSLSDILFSPPFHPFQLRQALDPFLSLSIDMNDPVCPICNVNVSTTEKSNLREHLVMEHFEKLRIDLANFQLVCHHRQGQKINFSEGAVKQTFTPHPDDPQYCICNICGIKQIANKFDFQMKHLRELHGYGMLTLKCNSCEGTGSGSIHELTINCHLLFQNLNTKNLPKDEFIKVVYETLDELLGFHIVAPKKNRCPICPTYTLTETSERSEMTKSQWRVHMVVMHFPFVCEKIVAFQSMSGNLGQGKGNTSLQPYPPQTSNQSIPYNSLQSVQSSFESLSPEMIGISTPIYKAKRKINNISIPQELLERIKLRMAYFNYNKSSTGRPPVPTSTIQRYSCENGEFFNMINVTSASGEPILIKSALETEKPSPKQDRIDPKLLSSFSIASILSGKH